MFISNTSIPGYIADILRKLKSAGFEAFIVGGCVRDAMLGRIPNDWDICTSALPDEIRMTLREYKVLDTGVTHGTVTAVKNGNLCEITTFRCDGSYTDHRRPDKVSFTRDITADLARRDFTINAMAYSEETGVIDLFGGKKDLQNRIIRCVGDPAIRFTEDALRIVRALRFASVLGFKIEEVTGSAVFSCSDLLDFVASERKYHELKLLLCGQNAYKIIVEYYSVFEKLLKHSNFSKNIHFLASAPKSFSIRMALLYQNVSKEQIQKSLRALKADNSTIEQVIFLTENNSIEFFSNSYSIKKILSDFGREKVKFLFQYISVTHNLSAAYKERIFSKLKSLPVITLKELAINGNDIISMGIDPGKNIKAALLYALDAVLKNECVNKKEDLILYLKASFISK